MSTRQALSRIYSRGKLAAALLSSAFLHLYLSAQAAEIRYVGAIAEGPTSPTSLVVGDFGLAALEPFALQIEMFTVDGVMTEKVDVQGDARGLAFLEAERFLFCDREGGAVYTVDVGTGAQRLLIAGLEAPVDVVSDGQRVLVLDAGTGSAVFATPDGAVVRTLKLQAPDQLPAGGWSDLAWDPARKITYVIDQTNSRILAFGADGTCDGTFSSFGGHDGEISRGGQIVCDADGWIYVTDRYQGRVVIFDENWNFVINADPQEMGESRLMTPTGIAVDRDGFVYVAATEGAAVHIFHLDKSAAAVSDLVVTAVSPGADFPVPANMVRLEAGIRVPATLASEVVVDFRLFAMSDTTTDVARIGDLPLVGGTILGNIAIGSVTWEPDVILEPEKTYGWQARARAAGIEGAWASTRTFLATVVALPFRLEQNSPNPFNPRTVIFFSLPDDSGGELVVYDLRGNALWKMDLGGFGPGRHQIVWEGKDSSGVSLPTGVYFYRLSSGGSIATRKMVLMR
jgi:sugar lactone lactonase YvrE